MRGKSFHCIQERGFHNLKKEVLIFLFILFVFCQFDGKFTLCKVTFSSL